MYVCAEVSNETEKKAPSKIKEICIENSQQVVTVS